MPGAGLEPTRIAPADFKSAASANSATPALTDAILPPLGKRFNHIKTKSFVIEWKSAIIQVNIIFRGKRTWTGALYIN